MNTKWIFPCCFFLILANASVAIDTQTPVRFPNAGEADVWLTAGQSNMLGQCANRTEPIEPDPRILYFSVDRKWRVAAEPLDRHCFPHGDAHGLVLEEGLTSPPGPEGKGAGSALYFAKHLLEHVDRPVGIIGVSTGGTIAKKWNPALNDGRGESFYEQLVDHIRAADRPLKGVIWYQGESDVLWSPSDAPLYEEGLTQLINSLRRDLNQPDLPFIVVQIGRFVAHYFPGQEGTSYAGDHVDDELETYTSAWDVVQEAQRRVARNINNVHLVSAVDLYPLADVIHLDLKAHQRLGRRLAEIALSEIDHLPGHGKPITIEAIQAHEGSITVHLDGVNGRFSSRGRPSGFEIRFPDVTPEQTKGQYKATIWDIDLSSGGPGVILLKCAAPLHLEWNPVLYYGAGSNPYCNIVDEKDIPIPAFGPLPIPYGAAQ